MLGFLVMLTDGRTVHFLGTNHLVFKDGYCYVVKANDKVDDMEIKGKIAVEKLKGIVHVQDTEM